MWVHTGHTCTMYIVYSFNDSKLIDFFVFFLYRTIWINRNQELKFQHWVLVQRVRVKWAKNWQSRLLKQNSSHWKIIPMISSLIKCPPMMYHSYKDINIIRTIIANRPALQAPWIEDTIHDIRAHLTIIEINADTNDKYMLQTYFDFHLNYFNQTHPTLFIIIIIIIEQINVKMWIEKCDSIFILFSYNIFQINFCWSCIIN